MVNMLKLTILLICVGLVWSMEDKNIVDGSWRVLNIKKCEDSERFPNQLNIRRRKCDRTTDCFDADLDFREVLDDSYGIECETWKEAEGGWKKYQDIGDTNVVTFSKKFADANVKNALEMMHLDPPDFPIKEGNYSIRNFKINYCELPKKCPEGSFQAICYIKKKEEQRACVYLELIFREELDVCD